ncbi:hypothetical protein OAH12_00640 [Cyclobacteriaceae bacterium]|nr:hypothetical protein [Cyclobacteriaceae bacterium]
MNIFCDDIIKQLHSEGVDLSYKLKGEGDDLILTFPGVGMPNRYFEQFCKDLEGRYKLLHFSLECFKEMKASRFEELWNQLLLELIKTIKPKKIHSLAFSIGARWLFYSHVKFESSVLIAPDGIVEHPVYKAVVRASLGKQIFRFLAPMIFLFLPKKLRRQIPSVKSLYFEWKLLMRNKFNEFSSNQMLVLLADKDIFICSNKIDQLVGYKESVRVVRHRVNHFYLAKCSKKEAIEIFK